MFKNMFRDKKSERMGMLVAACMFGLIALVQLWRAATGISLQFDGHSVPIVFSVLVGLLSLFMALWMGLILRHNRPVL
jgi:hypothetical protein